MVDENIVKGILKTYGEAWVGQDVDKILSIFTEDCVYHERVLKEPFRGHKKLSEYWQSKVVEEQSDIEFKLLNFYIARDTVIAEWDASFNSNVENARIHIREVAIMEIERGKIKSIREYWQQAEIVFKRPSAFRRLIGG